MNFALFGTFKEVEKGQTQDGDGSYLNVIGCQVAFHVAVLLFGWGRGRFVGGWEVSPVKRAER